MLIPKVPDFLTELEVAVLQFVLQDACQCFPQIGIIEVVQPVVSNEDELTVVSH